MNARTVTLALLAFALAAMAPAGNAQQNTPPAAAAPAARIALGSASGEPGQSVVVPLYFTPDAGARVGRLKIQVRFVSANLKFDKLETGIAAEIGNVELSHELAASRDDRGVESSALSLEAAAPETAANGIPAGLLAYIQMRLNAEARPAKISLRTTVEATETGTARPLNIVKPPDATVEVIAPGSQPAVVCFFFSH
jgi:hypothetical protein